MTRVHIICEGQTEAVFVRELLQPCFSPRGLFLYPAIIGKTGQKGGNVKFDRLRTDVRNRLLGDQGSYCTTFFDFYGLSKDFPGKAAAGAKRDPREKAETVHVELVSKLKSEIDEASMRRFIPYVQMYEFEALLFSDPINFAKGISKPELQGKLTKIREGFDTPEHINDHPHRAPSKRIEALLFRGYQKPLMGKSAAREISLARMRAECVLFNAWLTKLEALSARQK